jgi:hypothetical protein
MDGKEISWEGAKRQRKQQLSIIYLQDIIHEIF